MENDVVIEKVGAGHLGTIRSLADKIWPITYKEILSAEQIDYMIELFYGEDSLKKQFAKDTFILASINDEGVGFASYAGDDTGIYKLHKLYVLQSIQGRGLGKALVNFIVDDIKAAGGKALDLNVNRFNKAKSFYERLGFVVIREEDNDIGHGYWMNDYVMRLQL